MYHSFALIQWTPEQHDRLDDVLWSFDRPVMRVWLEWFRVDRDLPEVRLIEYGDGNAHSLTVARFHHHGRWLDWGSPPG